MCVWNLQNSRTRTWGYKGMPLWNPWKSLQIWNPWEVNFCDLPRRIHGVHDQQLLPSQALRWWLDRDSLWAWSAGGYIFQSIANYNSKMIYWLLFKNNAHFEYKQVKSLIFVLVCLEDECLKAFVSVDALWKIWSLSQRACRFSFQHLLFQKHPIEKTLENPRNTQENLRKSLGKM